MHISAGDVAAIAAVASAIAAIFSAKIALSAQSAATRQADATDKAAEAARDSARPAEALAKIEMAWRHEELAPSPVVTWKRERGERLPTENLFMLVTAAGPLDYRVTGEKRWTRNGTPSSTEIAPMLVRSGQTGRLNVGALHEGRSDLVMLHFDPAEGQPCPCGEPQSHGSGHWRKLIAVPEMAANEVTELPNA